MSAPDAVLSRIEAALFARRGRRCGADLSFCCPVHEDRHPSARWNPAKQVWYCHACGEGGGWKDLAQRLGIERPERIRVRGTRGRRTSPMSVPPPTLSQSRGSVTTSTLRAPIEHLDQAYRELARELGLSAAHRAHLLERRGLPSFALDGFASLPQLDARARGRIAQQVELECGRGPLSLAGVPGFYQTLHGWSLASAAAGILVPVLNERGLLRGCQVRADQVREGEPRYRWLSSPDRPGGCSSGSPLSVWLPDLVSDGAWITEGSLKGAIAAHRLRACVVAVAGVGNWSAVPSVLSVLLRPGGNVVIAYDADAATNPAVARHREALALGLARKGYAVHIADWNGDVAKGLDDALLAGLSPRVRPWLRWVPPVVAPRRTAHLPPLVHSAGVPLRAAI
jgi:hypothetical protein